MPSLKPLGCLHLVYFGVVVLVVILVVVVVTGVKIKSTPSPKTEVWTSDWSLTKEKFYPCLAALKPRSILLHPV